MFSDLILWGEGKSRARLFPRFMAYVAIGRVVSFTYTEKMNLWQGLKRRVVLNTMCLCYIQVGVSNKNNLKYFGGR